MEKRNKKPFDKEREIRTSPVVIIIRRRGPVSHTPYMIRTGKYRRQKETVSEFRISVILNPVILRKEQ